MSKPTDAVIIPLSSFDRNILPESERNLEGVELRKAIQARFEREFAHNLGTSQILVTEKEIVLKWSSDSSAPSATDLGIDFLSSGDYERGMQFLRVALSADPDDEIALYNLGMALSDKGQLDEAIHLLQKLTRLNESFVRAWVALGVALARKGDLSAATDALRKAVELDPSDGYAQRTLGALLASKESTQREAEAHLLKAKELLPNDTQILYNLGKLFESQNRLQQADEAYQTILSINPYGQDGKLAEKGRSRIAERSFREAGGKTRPDATMYCLSALQLFKDKPVAKVQKITFEIATLGMGGIDVNDPAQKYTLRSLPGDFSGLQLLCIEYVGFKQIDPSVDLGFNLSAEYDAALALRRQG